MFSRQKNERPTPESGETAIYRHRHGDHRLRRIHLVPTTNERDDEGEERLGRNTETRSASNHRSVPNGISLNLGSGSGLDANRITAPESGSEPLDEYAYPAEQSPLLDLPHPPGTARTEVSVALYGLPSRMARGRPKPRNDHANPTSTISTEPEYQDHTESRRSQTKRGRSARTTGLFHGRVSSKSANRRRCGQD